MQICENNYPKHFKTNIIGSDSNIAELYSNLKSVVEIDKGSNLF